MRQLQSYVAFIDIMGFSKIIEGFDNPEDLGKQLLINFNASLAAAINEQTQEVDITSNEFPKINDETIYFYQFSDSIILYTVDCSINSLEKIIKTLIMFMASSSLRGFPLRGALVKGDLYVNKSILVGKSIVKAAYLEKIQDWSGILIDLSCFENNDEVILKNRLLSNKLIVKADIPLKSLSDSKEPIDSFQYVVNWPEFIGMYISGEDDLKKKLAQYTGKPEGRAEEQINKTIKFAKENLGSKRLPPFRFEAELSDSLNLNLTEEIEVELTKFSHSEIEKIKN